MCLASLCYCCDKCRMQAVILEGLRRGSDWERKHHWYQTPSYMNYHAQLCLHSMETCWVLADKTTQHFSVDWLCTLTSHLSIPSYCSNPQSDWSHTILPAVLYFIYTKYNFLWWFSLPRMFSPPPSTLQTPAVTMEK